MRGEHAECAAAHAETLEKLPQIFTGYVALSEQPTRTDALRIGVEATAAEGFLSADATKSEVIKGLGLAIRAAVSDCSLSDTELARIQEIMNQFGLETNDIVEGSGLPDFARRGHYQCIPVDHGGEQDDVRLRDGLDEAGVQFPDLRCRSRGVRSR